MMAVHQLHDRTGRLETLAYDYSTGWSLHDRTGRLERRLKS